MKKVSKDIGVIFVLLDRFNKQRLPRALEFKKRVDSSELLNKQDHALLKEIFTDADRIR